MPKDIARSLVTGNTLDGVPSECVVFVKIFDRAVTDATRVTTKRTPRKEKQKWEARHWLMSDYAFWLGSMIFGLRATIILQNWVSAGCPDPETAWEERASLEKFADTRVK